MVKYAKRITFAFGLLFFMMATQENMHMFFKSIDVILGTIYIIFGAGGWE